MTVQGERMHCTRETRRRRHDEDGILGTERQGDVELPIDRDDNMDDRRVSPEEKEPDPQRLPWTREDRLVRQSRR